MGKKEKRKKEKLFSGGESGGSVSKSSVQTPSIGKRGWRLIFIGIGLLVLGFFILSLADSRGQNWASSVSPLTIIAGYVLIGFGLIASDPSSPNP